MNSKSLPSATELRVDLLRQAIGLFGLLLFGFTWKLWTPQAVFPQIPFFGFLVNCPGIVDWLALAVLFVSLVGMLFRFSNKHFAQVAVASFLTATILLISLDQHRLQPWAYQFLILGIGYLTLRPKHFLMAAKWLTISIYAYSAISKLDYQFTHTVGFEITRELASPFGINANLWDAEMRSSISYILVVAELFVAGLLLVPSQVAKYVSISMAIALHLALLFALGPLGLMHYPPVLIWNVFFIIQILLLFAKLPGDEKQLRSGGDQFPQASDTKQGKNPRLPPRFATLGWSAFAFAILFPLTSYWGLADHWASWELYSPRSSRVQYQVYSKNSSLLKTIGQAWQPKGDNYVDFGEWSLRSLGVPVYPQGRFQLGCAIAMESTFRQPVDRLKSVELLSMSDRFTGDRKKQTFQQTPPNRIEDHALSYWLNTSPRPLFERANKTE